MGHGDSERFGSLKIDDQIELGRLDNRQVGRLFALEYFADIDTGLAVAVRKSGP